MIKYNHNNKKNMFGGPYEKVCKAGIGNFIGSMYGVEWMWSVIYTGKQGTNRGRGCKYLQLKYGI